ncbi:MAG: Zn-ribbon domain-containing OB-fold protein [Thermoplasmatota archaeon]
MTVPRFWREIPQRYNLEASRCANCQAMHFPPREVCPTCRRRSIGRMERVNLAGRGRVVEWTRVHKAAPGYRNQVPYVIALIQAEEGPLMIGQIVDSPPEAIAAGAWVTAVFRRLGADGDAGVIYYGTKWQIASPTVAPKAVRRA